MIQTDISSLLEARSRLPGNHYYEPLDDVQAFIHYGRYGLIDPKMPAEAKGYQKLLGVGGWRGLAAGAALSISGGFFLAGVVGWAFDPADKRKGGIVEWKSYQKYVDPHVKNLNVGYRQAKHFFKSRGHRDYYFM